MSLCATLAGAAMVQCLASTPACVPLPPGLDDLRPLVLSTLRQESGFNPWVVRNETEGRTHWFTSYEAAVAYAIDKDRQGHVLGLGPGQHTWRANWRRHTGLADAAAAIRRMMEPCFNLAATATHYAAAYRAAAIYNAGEGRVGNPPPETRAYAMRVLQGAGREATTPAAAEPAREAAAPAPPRRTVTAYGRTVRAGEAAYAAPPPKEP